ncbi:MAG: tRNA guanosine(15) transglycosylase TgtA [Nitrososphaeria archaeon]|nr:tRNA guanosine(15) transglycosylase TgtA [Nitrososphaeria archaeon]
MPTFEVRKTDLAARIGRLRTRHGFIETPAILPVIHPFNQIIRPKEMLNIGFDAVMTNSYMILKRSRQTGECFEVHRLLDFEKTVMTDSGAYQILEYGHIEASPEEIVEFEKSIGSDIGVILDTPTGFTRDRRRAEETVNKTIDAAKRSIKYFEPSETLWTGPIQGGIFDDLLEKCAREMMKFNFDLYALGSPTQLMEKYDLENIAKMIVTVKRVLPLDKPLHLFGAGHPLTIPIAVALGCDLFDSASYILYAKRGAYMTEYGTEELDELKYLPCECNVCSGHSVKEIRESPEKVRLLALHNLHVLSKEIKFVKQAIEEGRLWEYVGVKCRAHPKAWSAFKLFKEYTSYLSEGTPVFKQKGLFFCSTPDQYRPEAEHSFKRILENLEIKRDILVLYLSTSNDHTFLYKLRREAEKVFSDRVEGIQFCAGIFPMAIAPIEVCDIYPFSQYETALPLDEEMRRESILRFKKFMRKFGFKKMVVVDHSNGKYDNIIEWFKRRKNIILKVVTDRRLEKILEEIGGLGIECS